MTVSMSCSAVVCQLSQTKAATQLSSTAQLSVWRSEFALVVGRVQ